MSVLVEAWHLFCWGDKILISAHLLLDTWVKRRIFHSPSSSPPYQTSRDGDMWRSDVLFRQIQPRDRGAYTCTIIGSTPSVTLTVVLFVDLGEPVCLLFLSLSILFSCIFEASLSQFHANRTVFHTSVCMLACLVRPLICTCTINFKWASSNGKPADSNNSWIRYMRVIQLGQIDTGSSTCSPSVLLSAMETSLKNTNKHP